MSESPEDNKLSRRSFLKAAVLAAGVPFLTKEPKDTPEVEIVGGLQIGNLSLTALLTEHREEDWNKNRDLITEKLQPFNVVIPEYFPPEYERLGSGLFSRGMRMYEDENKFFNHLSNYCLQQDKEIRVLDPAYNEAAIALRAISNIKVTGPLSLGVNGTVELAIRLFVGQISKKTGTPPKEIFPPAAKGILYALTTGFMHFQSMGYSIKLERDLRRVFIATAIVKLGEILPENSSAAIIYPPGHWYGENNEPGIINYLQNETLREQTFSQYESIYGKILPLKSLFRTRYYKPEEGKWIKQGGFSIKS